MLTLTFVISMLDVVLIDLVYLVLLLLLLFVLVAINIDDSGDDFIQHFGNGCVDEIVAVLLHELNNLGRIVGDDLGGPLAAVVAAVAAAVAAVLPGNTSACSGGKINDSTDHLILHRLAIGERILEQNHTVGVLLLLVLLVVYEDVRLGDVLLGHLEGILLFNLLRLPTIIVDDDAEIYFLLCHHHVVVVVVVVLLLLLVIVGHHNGLGGNETREGEEKDFGGLRGESLAQNERSNAADDGIANRGCCDGHHVACWWW